MLFSSEEFLLFFLPLFLLLYGIAATAFKKRIRVRNGVLLVFSLFFYAWGEAVYLFLLLFSIAMNFVVGKYIGKNLDKERQKAARAWLIAGVVLNLLALGIFKYAGFVSEMINAIPGVKVDVPDIALPIGISFFTFQIMSYIIDVYRRKVSVQDNIFTLAVYLCAFPQLIAGPIVRYSDVEIELKSRQETLDGCYSGARRFIAGLSKKVIISNTLAALCDGVIKAGITNSGMVGAWLAMLSYTLQIYYDFSGYSDMAIGLGRIMGFDYKENFLHPYGAISVTDFWRKWHISLSTFFKEYVYIPLGGNRVSKPRWVLNLMIVWGLTGLWHGASWNYVLWGLYFGILLVLEKLLWGNAIEKIPVIRHIYTSLAFILGWVFFRMESIKDIGVMFSAMFGKYGVLGINEKAWFLAAREGFGVYFLIIFIAAVILAYDHGRLTDKLKAHARLYATFAVVFDVFLVLGLIYSVVLLEVGSYNPFIYFRF